MNVKLNNEVTINLSKLIESRLLVQANSGGGKSWAIRRLIEQCFGKVQIIVLDPEGEFTNLREKYDFVFAGKGGDAVAEPRTAALLAKRLLELKASAIVDLYELNPQERKHFVRLFCDAMVNAQKDLWHDCLVIIDEAHVFAPEKGESEAMGSVIDLATRGRKRGYCVVLATQRLPKLNKDAAAECNNKLIGRASQDIDRKRAAEELGFTTKEQILSLRDLNPGEFYGFGPAISRDVIKLTVGDVNVKPPPRGISKHIPPPTDKIKNILAQLADLPQEVKKEVDTIKSLMAENAQLKHAARTHQCPTGPDPEKVRIQAENLIAKAKIDIEKSFDEEFKRFKKKVLTIKDLALKITKVLPDILNVISDIEGQRSNVHMPELRMPQLNIKPAPQRFIPASIPVNTSYISTETKEGITGPEQRVLDAIAWMEAIGVPHPQRPAVAFLAGYSNTRSTGFTNPCGALKSKGLISYPNGAQIALTDEGRSVAQPPTVEPTADGLQRVVLERLPGPERKLLEPLIGIWPSAMTNAELSAAAGYSNDRSTGYTNPRGRLRSFGLIDYTPDGVRAEDLLFPDGAR